MKNLLFLFLLCSTSLYAQNAKECIIGNSIILQDPNTKGMTLIIIDYDRGDDPIVNGFKESFKGLPAKESWTFAIFDEEYVVKYDKDSGYCFGGVCTTQKSDMISKLALFCKQLWLGTPSSQINMTNL
jgi:hypothetical protein